MVASERKTVHRRLFRRHGGLRLKDDTQETVEESWWPHTLRLYTREHGACMVAPDTGTLHRRRLNKLKA